MSAAVPAAKGMPAIIKPRPADEGNDKTGSHNPYGYAFNGLAYGIQQVVTIPVAKEVFDGVFYGQ